MLEKAYPPEGGEAVKERYLYPAIFSEDQDGVAVEFPDLPGCLTCANLIDEAFDMAREAMGLHLYGVEQRGESAPIPSVPSKLMTGLGPRQSIVMIEVWMAPIRGGVENKAVKKTLTIPKWLNDLAERQNVNFSQVLQDALKAHLGLVRFSAPGPIARTEGTSGVDLYETVDPRELQGKSVDELLKLLSRPMPGARGGRQDKS